MAATIDERELQGGTARKVSTLNLARLCCKESELYRREQSDSRGYCFELLRRAIVNQDQQAWAAVCEQYGRLVAKWVNAPPDRVDERVNETFAKFWQSVRPETFEAKFSQIGKVMAFLRACARSVCIDEHRREEKQGLLVGLDSAPLVGEDTTTSQAMDNVLRQELFAYIGQRLQDEQERLLMHLSFEVGLSPRQIAQEYPGHFESVVQVRRIKERVVLRLSSDSRLQEWWSSQVASEKAAGYRLLE